MVLLLRIRTLAGESGGTAAAVSLQGLELSYVIKARLGVEQELAVPINERKCKHRYVIWFPLLHHVQFHRSYMRRCSSIGNVSTFQVNI